MSRRSCTFHRCAACLSPVEGDHGTSRIKAIPTNGADDTTFYLAKSFVPSLYLLLIDRSFLPPILQREGASGLTWSKLCSGRDSDGDFKRQTSRSQKGVLAFLFISFVAVLAWGGNIGRKYAGRRRSGGSWE